METSDLKNEKVFELVKELLEDEDTIGLIQTRTMEFIKLMSCYRCALMEIETKFKVLSEEYKLKNDRDPISTVKTRLKSPASIREKLERRNMPMTLETMETELDDIAGVRVICSFPEDVYNIADAFLKQDDIVLLEKKDYIANPKPNGYRSLHIVVAIPIFLESEKRMMKVEIQFRTIAMDFWASLEHQLCYKKENNCSDAIAEELLQCAELSAQLDLRMDRLRKSVLEQG